MLQAGPVVMIYFLVYATWGFSSERLGCVLGSVPGSCALHLLARKRIREMPCTIMQSPLDKCREKSEVKFLNNIHFSTSIISCQIPPS